MRHHKLLYASSYDRGLQVLLRMWPDIKRNYPNAELHIAYGWDLFDKVAVGNPERISWKERMEDMMKQEGIIHHGRIGKDELKKLRQECGILAYPSDFTEIFCITIVEAQADGCVPVTTDIAALKETNKYGVVVKGDIYDAEVRQEYLIELLALMGDEKRWKELSEKGKSISTTFAWNTIADKWDTIFREPLATPLVTIVTPTIRKGFWNLMANNIASQSYKNIEWLIVDDHPDNREYVANEVAEKYNLNIRYMRGKKRKVKRFYSLVNANNTALREAKGELMVFLQDFVLMPQDGIEQLVTVYNHHPKALIAPVDVYHAPKIKPDTTSEDWFHGEIDVIGEFMRKNVRCQNLGMRYTQNPYDYEQNYGAIPTATARELGGWWEFFDEALGYDNTDIAYRALKAGYKIILDDTNVAVCIDHWNALQGTTENGANRERRLNDPRFLFTTSLIEEGKLPLKRTQELDDKIELLYEIPKKVETKDAVAWMRANMDRIVLDWINNYE